MPVVSETLSPTRIRLDKTLQPSCGEKKGVCDGAKSKKGKIAKKSKNDTKKDKKSKKSKTDSKKDKKIKKDKKGKGKKEPKDPKIYYMEGDRHIVL